MNELRKCFTTINQVVGAFDDLRALLAVANVVSRKPLAGDDEGLRLALIVDGQRTDISLCDANREAILGVLDNEIVGVVNRLTNLGVDLK